MAEAVGTAGEILIYKNQGGKIQLDVQLQQETVWLSQAQMVALFGRDKSVISRHINNIFKEGELAKSAVVAYFATTASDGKTYQVEYFNLDVIISVGYRVKSQQGTQFRIWATQRLKEYIVKGFVLNDERFKTGQSMHYFDELQQPIRDIRLISFPRSCVGTLCRPCSMHSHAGAWERGRLQS